MPDLTGSTFDVWKGLSEEDRKNCTQIKDTLHATYGVVWFMAWRKLTSYKIEQGQSLDSSCEDLHKWSRIVTATGSDPATALATVTFIEALPAHIAQKVSVLCGQQATKQQVIRAAKDVWNDTEVEQLHLFKACKKTKLFKLVQQPTASVLGVMQLDT